MRWFVALLMVVATAVHAAPLEIPGLSADATTYQSALTARAPAGMTLMARARAEQAVIDARARNDWAAQVTAIEARLAGDNATAELWLGLARAHLRTTPPNPARAAQAAWLAFGTSESGTPEVPALLVLADALSAANRPGPAIAALEAAQEREPKNAGTTALLVNARRKAGLLVRRVVTTPEADPPQACIAFTTSPARRTDFVPADWIRLTPAVPGAAITRQGDTICIAGLPLGTTTTATLRAGLPGEDGLSLRNEATLAIAMDNRAPRIVLDSRMFLLPRGQEAQLSLGTTNLSTVMLKVSRLTERTIVPWTKDTRLGEQLNRYSSETEAAAPVWEGQADIPHWQPNVIARTRLPLPDVFGEPGVYIVSVTAADGTKGDQDTIEARQVVIRTDLAPTVWRGTDGLTIQVRSFADASPRADVQLSLLARNNDLLAQAVTGKDGVARFAAPLLRGTGPLAPQNIHGASGTELVALDLTSPAFDLTDRGVEGLPHPGPLDAYAWTDRGIYRPGETVHVMALLRDAAGMPARMPAHVIIRRPNGQTLLDTVPPALGDASIHLPVTLAGTAPAGVWSIEVLADPKQPAIGRASFRVDAFVPDRMAVDVESTGVLVPRQDASVPVTARFLYGAPAAGLTGKATLKLTLDPDPPAALAGYQTGLVDEAFAPAEQEIVLAPTDAQGRTVVPVLLKTIPDSTRPVKAELDVAIDDPSGRASHGTATIKVKPGSALIGIKPGFDGSVDAGAEAKFQIAAVTADGTPTALVTRLKLVRERPDWRLVVNGSLARYQTVYRDEAVAEMDLALAAGTPAAFARNLDFGRYRLEVVEKSGLAATSVRFHAGWAQSDSPDTPDKADVMAGHRAYKPGETARIHVNAPFAGQATVLVLGGKVHSLRNVDVAASGTDIDIPVGDDWGPGAYAAVHVFRAGAGARPARAIGLVWLGIDPAGRTLPVAIGTPERTAPRATLVVPVRTAPGAWVTLAAVDEGILRLTKFASPDPASHFLGRRVLGLDIRDDWGRLIAPAEGEATALRQGGDDGASALPEIPQKTVSLFTPPTQAGADGLASITLDLPDFNGQVRLMATAWKDASIGAAATPLIVRDPLVVEPLLPRFLAPGDEAQMTVQLQNLDLPAGEAVATVSVEGPLAIKGDPRLVATLAPGAQALRTVTLAGTGAGRGVIRLDITGPGGFVLRRETAILVRPARAPLTFTSGGSLPPGVEAAIDPGLARMMAGTGSARATVGGPVRYDVAALVDALTAYQLNCLEQATSKGFPLALLPPTPDRAARLQASIASILDRQRFDGAFGMWSASGEAEPWLTAYATELLLRAKPSGAVPEGGLADAVKYLAGAYSDLPDTPDGTAAKAYSLYVLALAGQPKAGANRLLAQDLDALPTPLARAQLGAALALTNDRPRAEAAFAAALDTTQRKFWRTDYGSPLRDQAAVTLLLKESGLLPDKLQGLIDRLPGADVQPDALSTQEQAWAAAAGAVLGRDGRPVKVAQDGRAQPEAPIVQLALTGPTRLRNLGTTPVYQTVATTGVPVEAPAAARAGMRITRKFFLPNGEALNLDTLRQTMGFVLLFEGRSDDGQEHQALLLQGLPAGWEIAGRLAAGKTAGMPWLGDLTDTDAQPAADDRFAAVMTLTAAEPAFRIAVRLRAVTPGKFEMPGAYLSDMYRPGIFARQAAARITVLPRE